MNSTFELYVTMLIISVGPENILISQSKLVNVHIIRIKNNGLIMIAIFRRLLLQCVITTDSTLPEWGTWA